MERILIVEDDVKIAQLERDYLESNGYEVENVYDGSIAMEKLTSSVYDLVLLDLMLPNVNGYDICRTVRDELKIPILMVTAKSESMDIIRGLGLGADDYITKPFDPSELVARVRTHIRSYKRLMLSNTTKQVGNIQIQDIIIEPTTWSVWKQGKEIKLANREFELLCFLAEQPKIVFSKEFLFEKIWGYEYTSDAATVSVHINRLRDKIEDDARNPKIIETVWGAGYRLNP